MNFAELELHADLVGEPRATLDAMIASGINAPQASSCGRLFDAVAAALGICRERQAYEGEAAARLEAIVDRGDAARRGRGRSPIRSPFPICAARTALYRAAGDVARCSAISS